MNNESIQKQIKDWVELFFTLIKWMVLGMGTGMIIGAIGSVFAHTVTLVTEFRLENPWVLFGLPIGGLMIVALYKFADQEKHTGTNQVLSVIRVEEEEMNWKIAPLILISTVITHLFGGSSGREGAALQFGASVGNVLGKVIHLNKNDRKIIIMAIAFALIGMLFCHMLHGTEHKLKKWFKNPYVRVVVGAFAVIALRFILGTEDYLGLGEEILHHSFEEPAVFGIFLLKMIFTCLTLCAGFKGGEIVPSLFVGATLGSSLSVLFGLPTNICAGCGMVGVFCAVTNCPISSILIAFELFGFAGMQYYCITIAVCYLLSGYHSLYKEQKIVYSKTENKYINKSTH